MVVKVLLGALVRDKKEGLCDGLDHGYVFQRGYDIVKQLFGKVGFGVNLWIENGMGQD